MTMAVIEIPIEMLRRFSREDCYRLCDQGLLSRSTELIEGFLVEKITTSLKHNYIVSKLRSWMDSLGLTGMIVKQESPISIGNKVSVIIC